jgi:hypothetical protein
VHPSIALTELEEKIVIERTLNASISHSNKIERVNYDRVQAQLHH